MPGAMLMGVVASEKLPAAALDVQLRLSMDGANLGATFTDTSGYARSVSRTGSVVTKTDQSVFGGSSSYWDQNSFSTVIPGAPADWDFLTDTTVSFTIEGWIRVPDVSGIKTIATKGQNDTTEASSFFLVSGADLLFAIYRSSTYGGIGATLAGAISANTWVHVAAMFDASDRSIRVAAGGAVSAKSILYAASEYSVHNGKDLVVGRYNTATLPFLGHIDHLVITKGTAKYTAPYTPPLSPP